MSDVAMLEAALFQLRSGAEGVDAVYEKELQLCLIVLENAIAGARETMNAARVADVEFARMDLGAAIDGLPQADADRLNEPLQMIRDDVARLKAAMPLARELVDRIRDFRKKLRARGDAIELQRFTEGPEAPLPHPPAELRAE